MMFTLIACRVVNVHLFDDGGTSSSECFVDLESEVDVKDTLKKSGSQLDNKNIEGRISNNFRWSKMKNLLFLFY